MRRVIPGSPRVPDEPWVVYSGGTRFGEFANLEEAWRVAVEREAFDFTKVYVTYVIRGSTNQIFCVPRYPTTLPAVRAIVTQEGTTTVTPYVSTTCGQTDSNNTDGHVPPYSTL